MRAIFRTTRRWKSRGFGWQGGRAGSGLLALGFGKIGLWAEGETGKDDG